MLPLFGRAKDFPVLLGGPSPGAGSQPWSIAEAYPTEQHYALSSNGSILSSMSSASTATSTAHFSALATGQSGGAHEDSLSNTLGADNTGALNSATSTLASDVSSAEYSMAMRSKQALKRRREVACSRTCPEEIPSAPFNPFLLILTSSAQ
mmetsp:Transcript_71702/g.149856  ORF Transcript_71702/g.149856 Transcript_71702/m.149856 type:complete len:151 (-) Transcript_71702:548-1000(-)|eukprot:CAMPEP_0206454288 /NCGR_PEP_ID=MMETSP0324_2-20121206/21049_1 /ASSEMBLY_ACC=CAM_ASM_000836 /TAXON_ID=2866 /ORGANISM="Crypthecodinium cohnii, Strain Seligo" /LENGTH=150 /DNA_ID=CAMNT_0053924735 /DNA_START=71 /DNA_END=523 /DNA_ORIENTATION=-